jgi:hypothetical protein
MSEQISRRVFLQKAAIIGAGLAFLGYETLKENDPEYLIKIFDQLKSLPYGLTWSQTLDRTRVLAQGVTNHPRLPAKLTQLRLELSADTQHAFNAKTFILNQNNWEYQIDYQTVDKDNLNRVQPFVNDFDYYRPLLNGIHISVDYLPVNFSPQQTLDSSPTSPALPPTLSLARKSRLWFYPKGQYDPEHATKSFDDIIELKTPTQTPVNLYYHQETNVTDKFHDGISVRGWEDLPPHEAMDKYQKIVKALEKK